MIDVDVEYAAPRSVEDALRLLADTSSENLILAGGTDLLVQLHQRPPAAQRIVDVKLIPELARIEVDRDEVRIGAAVSCWEISQHSELRAMFPGVVEAAELIGSMQIQGRASLGGNLCNGSPAADTVPALIATGAQCAIAGPEGLRTAPAESFITAPGETILRGGEMLIELRIPAPPTRTSDAYLRFIPRAEMDIAVVGAGVSVTLDASGTCTSARVALGAVAPTPILVPEAAEALVGTSIDSDAVARAGEAASAAARPIDDMRGTAAYRRTVSGVLTRRAASIAAQRASRTEAGAQ